MGVCAAAIHTAEGAFREAPRTETCQRTYTGFSLEGGNDPVGEILVCWDTGWNLDVPGAGGGR